ncbi:glycosyl hydrolase family 28-related protein [Paenibacillus solisilvae]|uniref:Glycosyl hydrolase family 28-related protein n=1 Tax=Paenibacillus solisilvae TaxID=2486751 RepID=A0ABW0VTD2_9BACL
MNSRLGSCQGMIARIVVVLLLCSGIQAVPVYAAESNPDSAKVSISLGESPVEDGIHAWAGDYPEGLLTGTIGEKPYWQTNKLTPDPGTKYFYMNVDDSFLLDNSDQNVQVTVEYYDEGNGQMVLQYDANSAGFKDAPLFSYTDTKTWKTHTFELADAKFANRTNGGDFRLGVDGAGASSSTNADLKVASVTVTKSPKVVEDSNQVNIKLGEMPTENGITARGGDNEAGIVTGVLDGKGYWKTNRLAPDPKTLYMYMNVKDDYLYDNPNHDDVYVTVEYYDQGSGSIVLQYDADSAAFKDAPLFNYKNSGQWKTYTYKLSDANFANRTNGSDFRIGIDGGGASPANPDLYVASVTVKKLPRVNSDTQTAVVQTLYPTADIVIADFNAADFGAKGDGVTDDTQAIQDALDAAGNNGGGVVFVPAGRYRITGSLLVPTGVTLRGDWVNPQTEGAVKGTILESYAGRGDENGTSFIQLQFSNGVTNLSIWYPEQTLNDPAAYPWTIEQLTGDSANVENVTLVNAYNGIKIGPTWNELHYVKNVYGTALKTGIFLDYTTDIGRLEQIRLSPAAWAASGLPGSPSQEELSAYMTAHAEGIVMGRSDWEYMSDIQISGFRTGMRVTTRTDSLEAANAQMYRIRIENCNVALKIEGVNDFGLLITDSSFKASVGDSPKAIYATQGFHSIVQFNTVTVGGNPQHAVVNEGSGVLSFENSVIENWNDQAGGYAITADAGSLILGHTAFAKPDKQLLIKKSVFSVNAVNSGYQGELKVDNQSDAAELNIHQGDDAPLETLPAVSALDRAVQPKPSTAQLFNVIAAPYLADKNGVVDASSAVKQAITDAQAAGGGTVYFPAGIYRIDEAITVPTGVELRGSWDVPHHTIGGGSVLFTNYGENDASGVPFISLEASAGIRGLSIYYDQQSWTNVKPYAWTIQGKGHDVYAINTTLINPYQGIDFGSHDTSGHYISYVAGSPLKEGIFLGGGANGGMMRNVQFNPHYYGRNNYPNHPDGDGANLVWNYQKENLDAFRIGNVSNETVFNTFVFGSLYGIHFVDQDGHGPEAVVIGHGTDGSKKGAYVESAGAGGLNFINTELVSISTSDKVYVTIGEQFDSKATFFNTSMWGDTTRSFDIHAGKVRIQQSNFTNVGERGINVLGGDITLYDSYFQQGGTTHVYAGAETGKMIISNNIFKDGFKLVNLAPTKVTGTNMVPVSLELVKGIFSAEHPEQSNTVLRLNNLSAPNPISGTIELVLPSAYQSKLKPIRFTGVAIGTSVDIALPYLASDDLKYKVTLDNGYVYMTSLELGQSFAARSDAALPDAPAASLDNTDQYSSLGGQWKGTDDLSAEAGVKWDSNNLYFTIAVHDDVQFQSWKDVDIWQGDSIQLGIDLSRKDGAASQNVSELGFALNNDGTVTKWRWRAPSGLATGVLNESEAVVTRDADKGVTSYQITIPLAQLHSTDYTFSPDDPIGFALLMNENDGTGRSGFMEYNKGIGTSKNAALFGDLYLLDSGYTTLLEKSAAAAVNEAKQVKDTVHLDGAANFVNLLPEGNLKSDLQQQLADIGAGQGSGGGDGGSTGGGSTGGQTGGGITPPEPPADGSSIEQSEDGAVAIKTKSVLDAASHLGSSSVSQAVLEEAFKLAAAGKDGIKQLSILVSESESAQGYAVELPLRLLSLDSAGNIIELQTPSGTLLLPSNMLSSLQKEHRAEEKVTFYIRAADRASWSEKLQQQIGGRPAVDLSLQIGDQTTAWHNDQSPVTVRLPYAPTASELKDPEHLVVWYINGQGEAAPVPSGKYDQSTGQIVFQTTHFSAYAVTDVHKAFPDLLQVPWAKHAVEVLAAKGIINGTSAAAFEPAAPVKRADFIMMLVKSLGLTAPFTANFHDVNQGAYYYEAIGISKALGISQGSGSNAFKPDAAISREDAAVLLYRALQVRAAGLAAGKPDVLAAYADAGKVAPYAMESAASLVQAGLLQGSGGKLNPKGILSRAEAAVLLYHVYNQFS